MFLKLNKADHHQFELQAYIMTTAQTQKPFQPRQEYIENRNKSMRTCFVCVTSQGAPIARQGVKITSFYQYNLTFLNRKLFA
ncbi:hypothetical protein MITS9509_00219 [Synechococcus sp. MIT S9509]|nr:hypothetical protein MITS9509_00219 [Synechococcus sp. MIT S9509]